MKRHVALIIETSSMYGRDLLAGIVRYMRMHDRWSVFLEQRDLFKQPPSWLNDWKGDGIISRATTSRLVDAISNTGVPIVELTDRKAPVDLPQVGPMTQLLDGWVRSICRWWCWKSKSQDKGFAGIPSITSKLPPPNYCNHVAPVCDTITADWHGHARLLILLICFCYWSHIRRSHFDCIACCARNSSTFGLCAKIWTGASNVQRRECVVRIENAPTLENHKN